MKKVCIIGGGISGLLTLRHLNGQTDADLYEFQDEVGGQWIYNPLTEETTPSDNVFLQRTGYVPHSTYKGLISNLPRYCMTFMDYPYPFKTPTYITMEEFLRYIQSYVAYHGLQKYIHLGHYVESVHILPSRKYEVTIYSVKKKERFSKIYDYVVVGNGHNSKPYIPKVEGKFTGEQIHIHSLRELKPEVFYNKRVAIIGFNASARDVLLQLLPHKHRLKGMTVSGLGAITSVGDFEKTLTEQLKVEIKPRLTKFGMGKEVIFQDGSKEKFDFIIWTTGFVYDYSFLEKGILQNYSDPQRFKSFGPIYLKTIHVEYPSLLFVGLLESVPLLTYLIEWNAIVAASVILGRHKTDLSQISKLHEAELAELKEQNPTLRLIYRVNNLVKSFLEHIQDFKEFIGVPEETGSDDQVIMTSQLAALTADSFFLQNEAKRKIFFTPPACKGNVSDFAPKLPKLYGAPRL